MNALRKRAENQQPAVQRGVPVLVTDDVAAAESPARMLQTRLEEATLRSFYASAPASRTSLIGAGSVRAAGAIGGGLLVWGGFLALATYNFL